MEKVTVKAKNLSGKAPGGKRTKLANVLPLKTPFVVQVFPIYACNFKCGYCIFSVDKCDRHFISDKIVMEFDLFKKCIDDMDEFPDKIKVLRIVGIGEPLLHKNIADMIKYAVDKKIANTVELLTNASLLTPEMSNALIASGLSRLVVSLQGTSEQKYKEVCKTNINFTRLVNNLKYFYDNKSDAEVYIKIVDCALDDEDDKKNFYKIFGNICDTIAIENAVPIHSSVEFDKILHEKDVSVTQFGIPVSDVSVCPQPFFTMQINPDGKVVPCYSFEYPSIMGDCNTQSACDIWNDKNFQLFRYNMLNGAENASIICKDCSIIKYRLFPEDDLKNEAEQIKSFYEVNDE